MKILHFADLHLNIPFTGSNFPPEVARACRTRLRKTLHELLNLAAAEEVDAVTIGGDLFEADRLTRDTVEFLLSSFEQLSPIPIFIAPGNHDYYSPVSIYARYSWPENVYIFRQRRFQPIELNEDIVLWGFAHNAPDERDNPFHGFKVPSNGKINIALLHGSETGNFIENRAAHAPFQAHEILLSGFDFALLGHYHNASALKVNKKIAIYPGSPQPLSFGEGGEHGAALVEVLRDDIRVRPVITATQFFYTYTVDMSTFNGMSGLVPEIRSIAGDSPDREAAFLRLHLTGVIPEDAHLDKELLREQLQSYFDFVLIRDTTRPEAWYEELQNEPTVRGAFVKRLKKMMAEETDDRELILAAMRYGLQAFEDERIDLT